MSRTIGVWALGSLRFRVWGLGCRIEGLEIRIWGLGCGVYAVGFRVWGVGFGHLLHEDYQTLRSQVES